ncbi:MAG TPA: A24 family peptidase [Gaiellaceae bacterium]|nr:A24 family peptidase [Gaiellaceae bacterium]
MSSSTIPRVRLRDLALSRPLGAAAALGVAAACTTAAWRFPAGIEGVEAALFACVLVLLAAVDLERRLLPNVLVGPASGLLLALALAADPADGARRLAWAAGAFAVLLALALLRPAALGMGDVKLAFLLGAGLGSGVVAAFLVGSLTAGAAAVVLLVRHGRGARRMSIPLGPFLALGALVVLFA